MPAYDPDSEGDGRYVASFVEAAADVSPVFERRVEAVFDEVLGGADTDEWYRTGDIVTAFERLEQEAGEKTMEKGGRAAAKAVPWPDGVAGVEERLAFLDDAHRDAYRDSEMDAPGGGYTFESTGDRSARVGLTDAYPYPDSFGRGAFKGVVDTTVGTMPVLEHVSSRDGERSAWKMEW